MYSYGVQGTRVISIPLLSLRWIHILIAKQRPSNIHHRLNSHVRDDTHHIQNVVERRDVARVAVVGHQVRSRRWRPARLSWLRVRRETLVGILRVSPADII